MFPILFKWGFLTLYSFGFFFAIGVLLSYTLFVFLARSKGLPMEGVKALYLWVVVAAIVGARLFYVASSVSYYADHPVEIFALWQGGLIFYGGFTAGLAALLLGAKLRGLPFWRTADCFVAALASAQVFGRFGCFANGCCYGKPFAGLWAVRFPFLVESVHPTQLYEALYMFAVFAFLMWVLGTRTRDGTAALAYFSLYSLGRFLIEFLRGDHPAPFFGFLTAAQVVSVIVLAVTCGIWLILGKRDRAKSAFLPKS